MAPTMRFGTGFARSCLLAALVVIASGIEAQELSQELLSHFRYRSIGPTRQGGRIVDFAVPDPSKQPYTFYVAAANGGLWKTVNNGTTFEPIFDHQDVIAIGDVAVAPSDPDVVWVGTGEPNNSTTDPYASYWGDGVYKSTDAGETWTNRGLPESHQIGRIVFHPNDADVVYVAALGHLYTDNAERGVYRTTDGGMSWQQVLAIVEGGRHVSVVDLVIDPQDPKTLYAAAYDRTATPWMFFEGGPGSGIYKTTDGGDTWKKLETGLPTGAVGRIGLTLYPKDPDILYASILVQEPDDERYRNRVYRTDDAGETWRRVSPEDRRLTGGSYFGQIRVDPTDPDHVYVLGYGNAHSLDGGATWSLGFEWGGDNHALWIDERNPDRMLLGYDYGLAITHDGGENWYHPDELPLGQFYGICVDMHYPYNVYGGTQDFGTWKGPSTKKGRFPIRFEDWEHMLGGDGYFCQVDPESGRWLYAESQNGSLMVIDQRLGTRRRIMYDGNSDLRFNPDAPILLSRHDSNVIYHGANIVLRSLLRGEEWEEISADLTKNDPATRAVGPLAYGTITTLDESPLDKNVLWVGTDDGNVQLTRDGGETWTLLNDRIPGNPEYWVSRVTASHHDAGTAYVTYNGRRRDDFKAYAYKTVDYGATWESIAGGLSDEPINVIVEDHKNANLLFVGNEKAVYVSIDGGERWARMQNNMPTNGVHDLVIHPRENDLVVGTHGRSLFITDISSLQGLTSEVLGSKAYLFEIEPKVQWVMTRQPTVSAQNFAGENESHAVVVNYYLGAPSANVSIQVYDGETLINEITGPGTVGLNHVEWGMTRREPRPEEERARWDERQQYGEEDQEFYDYYDTVDFYGSADDEVTMDGRSMRSRVHDPGPTERDFKHFRVLPGEYTIVLTVGDQVMKRIARILADQWYEN